MALALVSPLLQQPMLMLLLLLWRLAPLLPRLLLQSPLLPPSLPQQQPQ